MKSILLAIALVCIMLLQGFGQVPQKFSYQAIIRNADGTVIVSQPVSVKISLHKGSSTGLVVYTETFNQNTSSQGGVSLSIGGGDAVGFATIPWSENIFIQVEVKRGSETNFTDLGTTQILSVPYAITAGSVKEVKSNSSSEDAIFEVKNNNGEVVFGVYQNGVRINVDNVATKGAKGGFAVGGLSGTTKGNAVEFLRITPDSTRIYIDTNTKGAKGGFAVGGLSGTTKAGSSDYFKVTSDTSYFKTTLFTNSNILSTGTVSTGVGTTSIAVKDADGYTYQTVKIGNQVWMKENLQSTKYSSDSSSISPFNEVAVYKQTTNPDTLKNFGRLYSMSAITSPKNVCPTGWHVPTEVDWQVLLEFVGGPNWMNDRMITGLKLMETGTVAGLDGFWNIQNNKATNTSGFSARPGGEGEASASWNFFMNMGLVGNWWGYVDPTTARFYRIDGNTGELMNGEGSNMSGYSVRCIKNK